MSFPSYPNYKDSGIEWLREVPIHWKTKRLKFLCNIQTGDKDTENAVEDGIYPFFVRSQTIERINSFSFDCEAILTAGDGAGVGKVFHYHRGPFDFHQRVYMLNAFQEVSGQFLFHFLRENFYKVALEGGAKSTVDSLRRPLFTNFPIVFPPLQEQQSIVAFVERESAKIDSLVVEQKQLIEILKEKHQALISHTVTKGLNPNVPMKPSGVNWLGDVPAHWGIVRSRRVFHVRNEPAHESDQQLTASQKHGVIFQTEFERLEGRRVVQIIKGIESLRHAEPNDFVISLRSFQGGIEWCRLSGSITFHYVVLVPIKGVYEPFFAHLFKSFTYIQALRSTTDLIRDGQDLRYSHFVQVELPLIPLKEQEIIASFLDCETSKFEALTAETQRAIDLLQERRTALISAAVTGQIDVRRVIPPSQVMADNLTINVAREILAAEILTHCHAEPTTGRIKLQKLIHLCEHVAELEEVCGDYERQAAGPFDGVLMDEIATGLRSRQWFNEELSEDRFIYRPLAKAGEHKAYLDSWRDKMGKVRWLIGLLKVADSKKCERVATLYAAWNDLLIEGRSPTDAEIIHQASDSELWHKSKSKIPPKKWASTLQWMKDEQVIPTGFGSHTRPLGSTRRTSDLTGGQLKLL